MYLFRRNQDPAPRLHYCFLTAPPLCLHVLPSLINHCLNLPFGTQGRSWRLKPIPYKQETGDTERLKCPGAPQGPAWFHYLGSPTSSGVKWRPTPTFQVGCEESSPTSPDHTYSCFPAHLYLPTCEALPHPPATCHPCFRLRLMYLPPL